ncbi:MAG: sialate O-acetylesterase [Verrucomicrobiaceae bacterium]|nr:sialate O-acetylesterase [Verrucomicrobiaceae bacterium]
MKKYLLTIYFIFCITAIFAEIKMSKIFSDNMMIQQNQPVEIWGNSDANSKIKILAGEVQAECKADLNGKWRAQLPSAKGSFKPFNIQIFENGKLAKEIKNVLRGEVWIAGGQSNMAMGLSGIEGAKEFVAKMQEGNVRYFVHPSPIDKMKSMKSGFGTQPCKDFIDGSKWISVDKQNAGGTSAVAFIFAHKLMEKIKAPVGIVFTAVSGSKMECWVSQQTYETSPDFTLIRKQFAEAFKNYDYKKSLDAFNAKVKKYNDDKKAGKKNLPPEWTVRDFMRPWADSPYMWKSPYMFYNIRIYPMRNYTAKGVIWYQGESNKAEGFVDAFKCLIGQWRKYFNNSKLPFICVQLPSYDSTQWPEIRKAQKRVAYTIPQTYIVPTLDTGNRKDIHPTDKMKIGERLAKKASMFVYGNLKNCKASCEVGKIEFINKGVKISFNDKPIIKGKLRGFEVLTNGKWISIDENIDMKIEKSECICGQWYVYLQFPAMKNVDGVRYLWKGWSKPDVCLFGADDLPVFPFECKKK